MNMKIPGINQAYGQDRLTRSGAGETTNPIGRTNNADAGQSSSGADRVTLSDGAKLVSQAVREAQDASDVRADKVAALKAQVESGNYQPDSKKIAAKMLTMESELFG